jgi:hypothetical protein
MAVTLGYPEPVATGELTQRFMGLQFASPDEDDLESGAQPFVVSYHGQKTLAQLQRLNTMWDMIQQGGQPNLSDLFALKEASKISMPMTESQALRTLKAFAVVLAVLCGTSSQIFKSYKSGVVEAYELHQAAVETYALSLPGKPVYAQIVRWVQLRLHSYWRLVIRTTTGVVSPPRFDDLFEQLEYKQWVRPALPPLYLTEKKPKEREEPRAKGDAPDGGKPKNKPKPKVEDSTYLLNESFDPELKTLGVEVGKISAFLKKIRRDGNFAECPKVGGSEACLTWHSKGHCWLHCDKQGTHLKPTQAERDSLVAFLKGGLAQIE